MYLMYKDTEVLYFDLNEYLVTVINADLLPYSLRGYTFENSNIKEIMQNIDHIKSYLSSRIISISRANAKQILTLFQFEQRMDINVRVEICIKCRGVSIQDSYWIRKENEIIKWKQINIRKNHFKDIVDISLNGNQPTITVNPICPDLTTKGMYPKGWIRDDDTLYLLKTDKLIGSNVNTRMEVLASKMLRCFNIDSVEYTGRLRNTTNGKVYVNKSECYVTEEYSYVEAWELMEYCRLKGMDYENYCLTKFGTQFANIPVIDFLLINTDRHTENYSFKMDDKGDLVGVGILYDFNNALVADYFRNTGIEDTMSQMFNKHESIKECMLRYLPYSDIKFDRKAFIRQRENSKEYKYIYDRVLERIDYINMIKRVCDL